MATPIIDQLSKDLAYKLQDPVTTGQAGDNGTRISAAERFRYILRGYRRLVRVVALLYPNMINQIFSKFFGIFSANTTGAGTYVLSNYISEIFETLAKEPAQEDFVRATYVQPEDWLSVIKGVNTFYYPDLNTRTYYWTLQQNMLQIAPGTIYNLSLSAKTDYVALMEYSGQNGANDIDIYTEYLDLILAAAAMEAYLDIGQPDLANAYMNDFTGQLQILATKMQKAEQKNET